MAIKLGGVGIVINKGKSIPEETFDDIPEAQRTNAPVTSASWLKPVLFLIGGLGLGAIAVLASVLYITQVSQQPSTSQDTETTASPSNENPDNPTAIVPSQPNSVTPSPTPSSPELNVENVLGHLPYKQASETELSPITANNQIRLRSAAAAKFQAMAQAAQSSGVNLVPLSGYRTVPEQEHLFFDVKAQRNQDASKRAEVSAPPGYSEHHTGYAIDIGDGRAPATNLSVSFENTAAFQWLQQNAARYDFELSFPRDNPQGISYEPWHWRFVGDIDSLETFYRAQNLPK
ncbi:MAG: D-alanyl-D-alanine carboxypeptidase family protein [Jaaginema sp. PMC 1079.18]|nr:D-alanyl-D-alanine carboxypeptidase family protein [Jaaginema sp. PMC 1080.18]MEC4853157.1 D-alanyl-D-alanine carboxypeptidase family protein [Jaaginema sp. PMC 1079.18]MEC4866820.1 D-alanyl-D-alanine carboxypeptidase family protein [Jaaginema sp. PMC 1078.18]